VRVLLAEVLRRHRDEVRPADYVVPKPSLFDAFRGTRRLGVPADIKQTVVDMENEMYGTSIRPE
jgi:hypothetical protein